MTTIVITGCSTGIGLDTAKYLKKIGYSVYPTVRKKDHLGSIRAMGFENVMLLDITSPEQITRVINSVIEEDGKIDVWFNNAGYGQPAAIEDLTIDALREQYETNVFGLHEATRQIVKVMREQGHGKIIQHSSVLGLVSLWGRGAYSSSKYAVEGLTDALRLELKGSNIYPVLLNTGPITSKFRKNAMLKLEENVDIVNSIHKEKYLKSLEAKKSDVPFNEEAISVAKVIHKIIKSSKPKPRYYITKATYLLGYMKRLLSTTVLDKILTKIG